MACAMNQEALQQFLVDRRIDAWLVYDFRGSNPILEQVLPGKRWTTRRVMLVIPATGEPLAIVHNIDAPQFAACGFALRVYSTWREWQSLVCEAASGKCVAIEYSPMGELPAVSFVDAGTLEYIRSIAATVVSSEDVIQFAVARWSPEALANHHRAARLTADVKDEAFALIRDRLAANEVVTERDVEH